MSSERAYGWRETAQGVGVSERIKVPGSRSGVEGGVESVFVYVIKFRASWSSSRSSHGMVTTRGTGDARGKRDEASKSARARRPRAERSDEI